MARVTVADCVDKVETRFELVVLCAQRAHDIRSGAQITVDRDNDKDPVIALREFAQEHINADFLKEELVNKLQKFNPIDSPDEPEEEDGVEVAAEEDFEYIADPSSLCLSEEDALIEQEVSLTDDTNLSNRN